MSSFRARHGDCCSGPPRRATSASGSATPTRSSTAPCRYAGRPVALGRRGRAPAPARPTRAFASRGVRVVALEPDPEMYAVLERETAGMPVRRC